MLVGLYLWLLLLGHSLLRIQLTLLFQSFLLALLLVQRVLGMGVVVVRNQRVSSKLLLHCSMDLRLLIINLIINHIHILVLILMLVIVWGHLLLLLVLQILV